MAMRETTYLLFKEQKQRKHVFTVQRTEVKETEMDSRIVTYGHKKDNYSLSPYSLLM